MRIRTISITKLFGLFDHVIRLNLGERITIIFGPNGFGKTVILRLVDALFNNNFAILRVYPFARFSIEFDNGETISIHQHLGYPLNSGFPSEVNLPLLRITHDTNPACQSFEVPPETGKATSKSRLVRTWGDLNTEQEPMSLIQKLKTVGTKQPQARGGFEPPEWFTSTLAAVNVRFIDTERLDLTAAKGQRHAGLAVRSLALERLSHKLTTAIKEVLAEYGGVSDQLDRSFPMRLVSTVQTPEQRPEQIRKRLEDLDKRRSDLINAGLLDQSFSQGFTSTPNVDEARLSVLALYLDDVEKKFKVFDVLAPKIEFLKKTVSARFLFKTLTVDKDKGLGFVSSAGTPLPLSSLSSGEQHELLFLCDLLFNTGRHSLVLIDEPEISLHVAWQEAFLRDLGAMAHLSDFDAVVATHSPEIISDKWNLTVELKGPGLAENG